MNSGNEQPETLHEGLPVAGYVKQSMTNVQLVNQHKEMEERLLRHLETVDSFITSPLSQALDSRWLSIARTHFEQGFMALNRSVFKPQRIQLPEDNNG